MNWNEKAVQGLINVRTTESHRIRLYSDRLAVSRMDGQRLTWEELQQVKQDVWGNRVCIEVYPAQNNVVNLRHTRHLWWSPEIENMVLDQCRHAEFNNTED